MTLSVESRYSAMHQHCATRHSEIILTPVGAHWIEAVIGKYPEQKIKITLAIRGVFVYGLKR
jgi:hypothetical protein